MGIKDSVNTQILEGLSEGELLVVSSSSNNAIYYYAKFYVANKDDFLRIGMSIQNEIVVASAKDVIAVPTYAIKNDAKGYYVEILQDQKAVKKIC